MNSLRKYIPKVSLSWVAAGLIVGGLIMMALTYIPIMVVEAKYQTLKGMEKLFGTNNLAKIILPTLNFSLEGRSKYRDYGITIPTLHLDEPVVFNVDPNDKTAYTAALKQGIAQASGTAFPDNPGLGYYFAHSSNPEFKSQFNAVFYLLGKLKADDDIYIWHENKQFHYRVTGQEITEPSDTSFLYGRVYNSEKIVLQTCWPPGTTEKRL